MEAIRPDEGPALKAGGGEQPLVSSSLDEIRLNFDRGSHPNWCATCLEKDGGHAACGFEPHGFRLNEQGVMVEQEEGSIAR